MCGVTTLRKAAFGAAMVALSFTGAAAAPVVGEWAGDSMGRPVVQTFLKTSAETERREVAPDRLGVPGGFDEPAAAPPAALGDRLTSLSVVETPEAAVCVLSRIIEILQSRYLAAETGAPVPFEQVVRSPATSFQIVADPVAPAGAAPRFRIQFKYSLDPAAPATLTGPFGEIDLQPHLEPSTDSVRLGPEGSAAVAAALGRGERLTASAVSRDTGRRVVDTLRLGDDAETAALRLAALEDCAAGLPALAAAPESEPQGALRFSFDLEPTSLTRLPEAERARVCARDDLEGPVHQGRALHATGFTLSSAAVYGHFDEAGELQALHVPGLLEARRVGGVFEAAVSRAANANTPDSVNEVSGCIGSAVVTLCLYPGEAGGLTLAPCIGGAEALFASGFGEEAPAGGEAIFASLPSGGGAGGGKTVIYPSGGRVSGPTGGSPFFGGGGGGGGFAPIIGGGSGGNDGDGNGDDGGDGLTPPGGQTPTPIPVPPAGLLLAAAAGVSAIVLRRRKAAAR